MAPNRRKPPIPLPNLFPDPNPVRRTDKPLIARNVTMPPYTKTTSVPLTIADRGNRRRRATARKLRRGR